MPTNLKTLLSRSRSRNELKGREKEEVSECCSCNEDESSPSSPPIEEHHSVTCQCQQDSEDSTGRKGVTNCEEEESSLRRDISSRSLFSLPAETDLTASPTISRPVSPSSGSIQLSTASTSPPISLTRISTLSMRKCETVLALSTFSTSDSPRGTSTSSSGNTSRVKVMKDRILSTSSSALTTLLSTSNKTTTKLFSGWKLSSSKSSSHHHHHLTATTSTPIKDPIESSKSQISLYETNIPLTPMNRLRRHGSIINTNSCCLNNVSLPYSRHGSLSSVISWTENQNNISCRLCLCEVKIEDTIEIIACSCRYCKDCVTAYVTFEVEEGAYDIACPDAACEKQGVLSVSEIEILVPNHIVEKYKKFRLFKDVETNYELMWCPTPGCETICKIQESQVNVPKPGIRTIECLRCNHVYCVECRLPVHVDLSCEAYRQKLIRQGKLNPVDEETFSAYDSIKKCPFCRVPIEKDSGCAQMMCKRCKHVFCWYCLASLDDDFLLRHYDKGPCKNKLGHSRASVVWHRTQVIGIFAGFGLLVLLASPLLILAAPCLLCCRCRYCNSTLDTDESPVSI